jgi:peptidoglycan DL-endopeptidase CwlO
MAEPTRRRRARTARLTVAALLAISLAVLSGAVSVATPTRQDLLNAKDRLAELNNQLSALVERYDAAQVALHRTEARLVVVKAEASRAQAAAAVAKAQLAARTTRAYEYAGSGIDVLLGSATITEAADKLQFLNDIAQQDQDAIVQARVTGQRALWATQQLTAALTQRQALVRSLSASKAQIQAGIAQQQALITQLEKDLAKAAVRKIVNQPGPAAQPATTPAPSPSPPGGGGTPQPPPPSSRAAIAVKAAYSAIGTPYVWGGSSPSSGFDCSGLTMWSWGQAGVSLPHSSAAQYSATPRVPQSGLQPGDLLFFYSPIHHVAMYVGGGQMIHASHPGTTVSLETISSYYWAVYVGAGRPG